MAFRLAIDVNRPVPEVFVFFSDGGRTPLWQASVRSAERLTPGATGVGTTFRFVRELAGGNVVERVRVAAFGRDGHVTFACDGGATYHVRYVFARRFSGTLVTLHGAVRTRGRTAYRGPTAPHAFARALDHDLRTAKPRDRNAPSRRRRQRPPSSGPSRSSVDASRRPVPFERRSPGGASASVASSGVRSRRRSRDRGARWARSLSRR